MASFDEEIAAVEARLAGLKEKQREAEAKERARFADAVVGVIDEIDNPDEVSVRELVDRVRALLDEQDRKRKRAAAKAAAARRANRDAAESGPLSEAFDETGNHTVGGDHRVDV